jgi:hypothetical protein
MATCNRTIGVRYGLEAEGDEEEEEEDAIEVGLEEVDKLGEDWDAEVTANGTQYVRRGPSEGS